MQVCVMCVLMGEVCVCVCEVYNMSTCQPSTFPCTQISRAHFVFWCENDGKATIVETPTTILAFLVIAHKTIATDDMNFLGLVSVG